MTIAFKAPNEALGAIRFEGETYGKVSNEHRQSPFCSDFRSGDLESEI